MGWVISVAIIQDFLRRFVYHAGLIDPSCELCVGKPFPISQAALTCLDGFDVITKLPPLPDRDDKGRLFP